MVDRLICCMFWPCLYMSLAFLCVFMAWLALHFLWSTSVFKCCFTGTYMRGNSRVIFSVSVWLCFSSRIYHGAFMTCEIWSSQTQTPLCRWRICPLKLDNQKTNHAGTRKGTQTWDLYQPLKLNIYTSFLPKTEASLRVVCLCLLCAHMRTCMIFLREVCVVFF